MKVFAFIGEETDWIAANDEAEARAFLMRNYGLNAEDVDYSYERVEEVAPEALFDTDEYDEEEDAYVKTTASHLGFGRTKPFVVGSTYW